MKEAMMRYAALFAVLALAACQPASETTTAAEATTGDTLTDPSFSCANAQPTGETFSVACDGGKTFSVAYAEGTACAIVTAGGQTYRLPAAISASGARYNGDGVEYWEHQGDALFTGAAGGPYENCKLPPQDD